jgi:hypothetical protein
MYDKFKNFRKIVVNRYGPIISDRTSSLKKKKKKKIIIIIIIIMLLSTKNVIQHFGLKTEYPD